MPPPVPPHVASWKTDFHKFPTAPDAVSEIRLT